MQSDIEKAQQGCERVARSWMSWSRCCSSFSERNGRTARELLCRPGFKSMVVKLEVMDGRWCDKRNWKLQKNEVCFSGSPSMRKQNWAGRGHLGTRCKGPNGKMLEKMSWGYLSYFCWIKCICLKIAFWKVYSVACCVIKGGSNEPEYPALGEVLKVCVTYKGFHRTGASVRHLVMQSTFSGIYGLCGQGCI